MAVSDRAIGLLGGTFDPVHNGHVSIAKSFLNSPYISSLLILLTPEPPHKPSREFASYSQRLKMLMAAFESIDKVKVSDLEFTLPKPSYTYQTVRYLNKSYSDTSLYLCLGEDSLQNFKKWHKWKGILEFCELLVAERPETGNKDHHDDLLRYTHFIQHKPVAISSTQIKKRLTNDKTIKNMVPEGVSDIIEQEKLYR